MRPSFGYWRPQPHARLMHDFLGIGSPIATRTVEKLGGATQAVTKISSDLISPRTLAGLAARARTGGSTSSAGRAIRSATAYVDRSTTRRAAASTETSNWSA